MRSRIIRLIVIFGFSSVTTVVTADNKPLPKQVDLSSEFDNLSLPPRAQGNRDVCSLFAITGLVNFEYARHRPDSHTQFSEEFLIWAAQKSTGKTGDQAMFYEAICGLNQMGICSDHSMPYAKTADAHRKPSAQAITEAHQLSLHWNVNWIKRWDLTNPLTDLQIGEIKRALADHHPVACGMRWPKKGNGHQLLKVLAANEVEDGHSILLTGYVDDPRQVGGSKFLFRNSWGTGWGNHGYGEMSAGYLRAYTNDSVWIRFHEMAEVPSFRFEAESLPIMGRHKCETNPQSMGEFHGLMWSGGKQLFCRTNRGGHVDLGFDVAKPGRYQVRVHATAAPDFGIIRIGFPGGQKFSDFDLYSGRICPAGALELGSFDFEARRYALRITAVDNNRSSQDNNFGIDAIELFLAK